MDLNEITFQGPEIDDFALLELLPADFRQLLIQVNGFIKFDGGLHVRGICTNPNWHSLVNIWMGDLALSTLYPSIKKQDIPFGQDCVGDQFILRDNIVYRLWAETGELDSLKCNLNEFLNNADSDSVQYLSLQPLLQYRLEGGLLHPGKLLSVYPPFCTKESATGVSLRAISSLERISFLADFASQIDPDS